MSPPRLVRLDFLTLALLAFLPTSSKATTATSKAVRPLVRAAGASVFLHLAPRDNRSTSHFGMPPVSSFNRVVKAEGPRTSAQSWVNMHRDRAVEVSEDYKQYPGLNLENLLPTAHHIPSLQKEALSPVGVAQDPAKHGKAGEKPYGLGNEWFQVYETQVFSVKDPWQEDKEVKFRVFVAVNPEDKRYRLYVSARPVKAVDGEGLGEFRNSRHDSPQWRLANRVCGEVQNVLDTFAWRRGLHLQSYRLMQHSGIMVLDPDTPTGVAIRPRITKKENGEENLDQVPHYHYFFRAVPGSEAIKNFPYEGPEWTTNVPHEDHLKESMNLLEKFQWQDRQGHDARERVERPRSDLFKLISFKLELRDFFIEHLRSAEYVANVINEQGIRLKGTVDPLGVQGKVFRGGVSGKEDTKIEIPLEDVRRGLSPEQCELTEKID